MIKIFDEARTKARSQACIVSETILTWAEKNPQTVSRWDGMVLQGVTYMTTVLPPYTPKPLNQLGVQAGTWAPFFTPNLVVLPSLSWSLVQAQDAKSWIQIVLGTVPPMHILPLLLLPCQLITCSPMMMGPGPIPYPYLAWSQFLFQNSNPLLWGDKLPAGSWGWSFLQLFHLHRGLGLVSLLPTPK